MTSFYGSMLNAAQKWQRAKRQKGRYMNTPMICDANKYGIRRATAYNVSGVSSIRSNFSRAFCVRMLFKPALPPSRNKQPDNVPQINDRKSADNSEQAAVKSEALIKSNPMACFCTAHQVSLHSKRQGQKNNRYQLTRHQPTIRALQILPQSLTKVR